MTRAEEWTAFLARRYVWDFWYHHDSDSGVFSVFFLNADREFARHDLHHQHAQVGLARTRDFETFELVDQAVLEARPSRWDNTSIWTGDVVRLRNEFLMFYTSRDRRTDDGFTQCIGAARSADMISWRRDEDVKIEADPRFYEPASVPADDSVHAWRDPFLMRFAGETYMLISAKARTRPPGRKGAVGLLRARDARLVTWDVLPPVLDPGCFGEMEVPQIYRRLDGSLYAVFSCWARNSRWGASVATGGFFGISVDGFPASGPTMPEFDLILPEHSGLYACRVVPELAGEVVGFSVSSGGIQRSGVTTQLVHADRDFRGFE